MTIGGTFTELDDINTEVGGELGSFEDETVLLVEPLGLGTTVDALSVDAEDTVSVPLPPPTIGIVTLDVTTVGMADN